LFSKQKWHAFFSERDSSVLKPPATR